MSEESPEIQKNSAAEVTLAGLGGSPEAKALLEIGDKINFGESGVVRQAYVTLKGRERVLRYPVALKTYTEQDTARAGGGNIPQNMTEMNNDAYEAQLILYECLRRAGVKVIPTFRLAIDSSGNTQGIVMTNLESQALSVNAEVTRVDSTKTDERGSLITGITRNMDAIKARGIGITLAHDSWMLQYSTRWNGLGKVVPQAVVSDIIGLKITDREKLADFLARNPDLNDKAHENPVVFTAIV